jgi:uncharacterized protein YcfJ
MKHLTSIASLLLLSLCSAGYAQRATEFTDTGTVISSRPVYERAIHPRKECYNEEVTDRPSEREYRRGNDRGERDLGGTIIGGIAGGLLGSQIGKGNGKTAAAAVGAVTGAVVGDKIANDGNNNNRRYDDDDDRRPRTHTVQRCHEVEEEREEIRGYDVKYKFNGTVRSIRMSRDPGSKVRLAVTVIEDR